MTALEPPPSRDPELLERIEARTVRCPRCAAEPGNDCGMTKYPPPTPKAARTFHGVRLQRAHQGW